MYSCRMTLTVRMVEPGDENTWMELYAGYRAFYHLPDDPAATQTTWQWVRHGKHGLVGLVAVDDMNSLVALANLRWFARPSSATLGLYLDDLFTAPLARGAGAASALLAHASDYASERQASIVRWITASDNTTARSLYDSHAVTTSWVTYDMAPTTRPA